MLSIEEPRVIRRANILNCLHLAYVSSDIASILNVDPKTVTNVGHAYLDGGLDSALYDEERDGRPIDFDDRERSRIVAMVCSDPPQGFYRWTLDLIVQEAQRRQLVEGAISRETVRVILQEHDLKPWQEKMWCIAELNEEYIERMEDVLDVYEQPHNPKRPVVCVDEKPVALISDATEQVAASVGCARSTVQECLRRARAAGIGWPPAAQLDDAALNARLYARRAPPSRPPSAIAEPDFAYIARELTRKHVTRRQLWREHTAANPQGLRYTAFCVHFQRWRATAGADVTLAQDTFPANICSSITAAIRPT